jgi:hypothetical protein
MQCPHCCSAKTMERSDRTTHGYRRFRCRGCGRGRLLTDITALRDLKVDQHGHGEHAQGSLNHPLIFPIVKSMPYRSMGNRLLPP